MTSSVGQAEVTSSTSPMCDLIGPVNEVEIRIGEHKCRSLIDTGSMISSISETFYRDYLKDKYPMQDINSLLQVEGAGGHQLHYIGYADIEISIPDKLSSPLWVPILIAPDTSYNH